jgi:hypothetical protein
VALLETAFTKFSEWVVKQIYKVADRKVSVAAGADSVARELRFNAANVGTNPPGPVNEEIYRSLRFVDWETHRNSLHAVTRKKQDPRLWQEVAEAYEELQRMQQRAAPEAFGSAGKARGRG